MVCPQNALSLLLLLKMHLCARKNLLNSGLKNDLEKTSISIYDGSFNSGHSPISDSLGQVYVQYIADTLIGHPLSQAFISNDGSIINDINNSNIYSQFTNALINGLNTTTFQSILLPPLITGREFHSSIAFNGKIVYVFGGNLEFGYTDTIEKYN